MGKLIYKDTMIQKTITNNVWSLLRVYIFIQLCFYFREGCWSTDIYHSFPQLMVVHGESFFGPEVAEIADQLAQKFDGLIIWSTSTIYYESFKRYTCNNVSWVGLSWWDLGALNNSATSTIQVSSSAVKPSPFIQRSASPTPRYSFKDGLFTAATDNPKWQVAHRVLIQPFSVRGREVLL